MTTFINGRSFKDRSLNVILSKITECEQVRLRLYNKRWKPWTEEGDKLNKFWGMYKRDKICINFSEYGFNSNVLTTPEELALIVDEKKLPLLIHDPKWASALNVIEKRLKGELQPPLKRQDLLDEYFRLQIRDKHIGMIHGWYKELLYHYLRSNHLNNIYNHNRTVQLIVLTNNNRNFYVTLTKNNFHLHSQSEIYNVDEKDSTGD
jgi:hypothetical protein